MAAMGRLEWASPKAQCSFLFIQNYSNGFELIRSKGRLPLLENFKKKFGIEGFEERNNFSYRNFSQFRINFELKFREVLGFEIDRKLMEISWNFRI
jgi:hypothetical protein